jgi:hypothetical protein
MSRCTFRSLGTTRRGLRIFRIAPTPLACFVVWSVLAGGSLFGQSPEEDLWKEEPAWSEIAWQPLFNGEDLSGWTFVNTPPQTWSVEDGMLVCSGKPYGEIRTERMYQNFILEVEWRHMRPAGNAGIFVWADDITARGSPFHRGIEVQVLENAYGNTKSHTTHGDVFPIQGASMTPVNGRGGQRAFPTEHRANPSPEWNHYRILCHAGAISLAVNGKVVTRGYDAVPRKGYICIESEGGIVHYRNMRIKKLPKTPLDEGQMAIADRGFRSIYTGLDLSGWDASDQAREAWKADGWVLKYDGSAGVDDSALTSNIARKTLEGFLCDFRFSEESEQLAISLPGWKEPILIAARPTPGQAADAEHHDEIAAALEPVGKWNRAEFETTDYYGLVLILNQVRIPLDIESLMNESDDDSPIQISPQGEIDLANLYIR